MSGHRMEPALGMSIHVAKPVQTGGAMSMNVRTPVQTGSTISIDIVVRRQPQLDRMVTGTG